MAKVRNRIKENKQIKELAAVVRKYVRVESEQTPEGKLKNQRRTEHINKLWKMLTTVNRRKPL